jgi:Zn-finger nucleic acid-binding protein
VLVEVRHLVPLLQNLTADLAAEVDLETPIEPHDDLGEGLSCPRCAGPMTHFGYMGTNRVWLDRCGSCLVIWADGDELETLTMLHARTHVRSDERQRWHREQQAGLERRVSGMLVARAMSNHFAGGF